MPRNDTLLQGAAITFQNARIRTVGAKTRYNHLKEVERFVMILREVGYGVKKWTNVNNKHVESVVTHWQEKGLSPKTIKEYLSGVRVVAGFFGNTSISGENARFGIPEIKYITNADKSLPKEHYERALKTLLLREHPHDERIAAMFKLERYLGLRTEEAAKFNPRESLLPGGRVYVCRGTKGGRERTLGTVSGDARKAMEFAEKIIGSKKNLIPKAEGMTEQEWRGIYYARLREIGITKSLSNASGHGNRHAYAQERYIGHTGYACPCKFSQVNEFVKNAKYTAGEEWLEKDRDIRMILKAELGHGPDRDQVVSQYIGSVKSP